MPLQVFLTPTHLVLAMEYAAGGDLYKYVSSRRGVAEDEARWFFQQLVVAVDYCHRMVSIVGVPLLWCSAVQYDAERRTHLHQGSGTLGCCRLRPQGVTSRDIKLENTLLDGARWPLIKVGTVPGFALSCVWRQQMLMIAPPSSIALPACLRWKPAAG